MKSSFPFLKRFFVALLFAGTIYFPCLATEETTVTPTSYPLLTCVVSGEKLGVMGPPVIVQHQGREVRFCCQECIKDFNKDPQKYLKELQIPSRS